MSRRSGRPPDKLLLLLAYLGFVSLGLPDAVLGIVWPSVRATFALPQAAIGWPLSAAAIGYVLSGLLAGRVLAAVGVGWLLGGSTLLVSLGVAGYAFSTTSVVFVGAACVVGWGSGAVDTGLNAYASEHLGPRHMAFLHAAYSVGAALGAVTMSAFIAGARSWRDGYALIMLVLGTLAAAFVGTVKRWRAPPSEQTPAAFVDSAVAVSNDARAVDAAPVEPLGTFAASRLGAVRVQALLFFLYSGVELGIGHWSYTILTQARGLAPAGAAFAVSAYWTCLLAGRLLAGLSVDRIGNVLLVRVGMVVAVAAALGFAAVSWSAPASAAVLGLLGLAIAPIYPGLMSETPRRVGARAAPHAIGFQVSAATAGAVLLPTLGGALAEWRGLEWTAASIALTALALVLLHELLLRTADAPQRSGVNSSASGS